MNRTVKSFLCFIITVCILLSIPTYSTAVATDFEPTDKIIESIPQISDGYELEKIETKLIDNFTIYNEAMAESYSVVDRIIVFINSVFYKLGGKKVSGDVYFKNEYSTYIYDGPMNINTVFWVEERAQKSVKKKIPDKMIEDATGTSLSSTYKMSTNFSYKVNSNQRIYVRIYPVYSKIDFKIYNRFTDNVAEDGCFVLKPKGIYITVATYKK